MSTRIKALLTTAAVALGVVAAAPPAQAVGGGGWPITPGSFGIMYGNADSDTISAVRAWEAATWCRIQPTPDSDMQAYLAGTLGVQLDSQRAVGATTAVVGLGHPPAWVFDNAASANRPVVQYGCDSNAAAGVSIPNYASLKRSRDGSLPLQAQRWRNYVGAVIDFLNNRYGGSMSIMLQVWNEPNLSSGLSWRTKVPGSSRSAKDAVKSLYELERITREAVDARGNPAITLTSTALHHRPNTFAKLYLAKQGRAPVVSSLAFNVYSYKVKTPDAMVRKWNKRVASIKKRVNKHRRLRALPAHIGETNHNLVNNGRDNSNVRPGVTAPESQRRLAAATQMDAYYFGFRSVYWLAGPQVQSAANIWHYPGTPARSALTVLRSQLIDSIITGCASRRGVRRCTFATPGGQGLTVYWRMSGASRVRLPGPSTVVQMTGATQAVAPGTQLTVGTTPIVVRPA